MERGAMRARSAEYERVEELLRELDAPKTSAQHGTRSSVQHGEDEPKPSSSTSNYDPGETLVVFSRGESERLRLARKVFHDREFLDLRIEWRDAAGRWLPSKKGTSIKLREIDALAAALTKAVDHKESGA
jgi:hypothetical protein